MKMFYQTVTHNSKTKMTLLASVALSFFTLNSHPVMANASPMLGEIEYVGFNFCPRGWAEANGQLLPINSNQSLYSLLGTTFGGDGRTTFALPDYRGRTAIGQGGAIQTGEKVGAESVTLTANNIPEHTHLATTTTSVNASSERGRTPSPVGALLANDGADRIYSGEAADIALSSQAIISTTTVETSPNSPVSNMQPYQVLTVCIALQGTFPSRS